MREKKYRERENIRTAHCAWGTRQAVTLTPRHVWGVERKQTDSKQPYRTFT